MNCIVCNNKTTTRETRILLSGVVVRRRKCLSCGYKFFTVEEAVDYDDIRQEYRETINAMMYEKRKEKNNGKRSIGDQV